MAGGQNFSSADTSTDAPSSSRQCASRTVSVGEFPLPFAPSLENCASSPIFSAFDSMSVSRSPRLRSIMPSNADGPRRISRAEVHRWYWNV